MVHGLVSFGKESANRTVEVDRGAAPPSKKHGNIPQGVSTPVECINPGSVRDPVWSWCGIDSVLKDIDEGLWGRGRGVTEAPSCQVFVTEIVDLGLQFRRIRKSAKDE